MKTTKANLELRDENNNLVKTLKKNIPLEKAFEYFRKREVIWKGSTPYNVVIAWN